MNIFSQIPTLAWLIIVPLLAYIIWSIGIWWYAAHIETPSYIVTESIQIPVETKTEYIPITDEDNDAELTDSETPKYRMLKNTGDYELRQYDPILVAQVKVQDRNGMNNGFSQLAEFIFGGNQSQQSVKMTTPVMDQPGQSIKMTTPVIDQPVGVGERVITFTMPEKWTRETLPVPNNQNVQIVEWPAQTKAVLRFKILNNDNQSVRQEATDRLLAALEADGISHQGDVTFAFYNPPWTPFFLRRNEVMVTVSE